MQILFQTYLTQNNVYKLFPATLCMKTNVTSVGSHTVDLNTLYVMSQFLIVLIIRETRKM